MAQVIFAHEVIFGEEFNLSDIILFRRFSGKTNASLPEMCCFYLFFYRPREINRRPTYAEVRVTVSIN